MLCAHLPHLLADGGTRGVMIRNLHQLAPHHSCPWSSPSQLSVELPITAVREAPHHSCPWSSPLELSVELPVTAVCGAPHYSCPWSSLSQLSMELCITAVHGAPHHSCSWSSPSQLSMELLITPVCGAPHHSCPQSMWYFSWHISSFSAWISQSYNCCRLPDLKTRSRLFVF